MIELKWHKLDSNAKKKLLSVKSKVFIPGTIFMDEKRIKEVVEDYSKDAILIFGNLMDEWIPDMENFEQFRPLSHDQLVTAAKKIKNTKNLAVMEHFFAHTKYIIRELKPNRLLFVNGSQKNIVHAQPQYWEGVDVGAKMELISPFSSEDEAKKRALEITKLNEDRVKKAFKEISSKKKLVPEKVFEFCVEVSKNSWDWTGLMGAVITRGDKILAYSHNAVLPYESALMHRGSKREKILSPLGQDQELGSTVHAELACILKIADSNETLQGTDLYTKAFPCPYCARVIAHSPIEKIYYSDEYVNQLGYDTLKEAGKKTIRL